MSVFNRHTVVSELKNNSKTFTSITPQQNIHGDTPFIVKLQHQPGSLVPIMCYDRQRSFTNLISKESDSDTTAFDKIVNAINSCPVFEGQKIYRWAKRVDEWHLSICLDVEPKGRFLW